MRFLLKVLFAPVSAVLAIMTWFLTFMVSLSGAILGIISAILGFFGVFILIADSTRYGIGLLILAFLVSPYGLPMLAAWLVGKLHGLRYAIQDWLY